MKALIIIGSTRPVRVGDQIAGVVNRILRERGVETDVVDLRELNLPLLDEPKVAATGQYAHEHTRRWAERVTAADAVVVVTPQYNGGYPAGLKNAVDYLFQEWRGKPGAIVSYGGHGGGKAYDQLHQVLSFLGIELDPEGVQISLARDAYGENDTLTDPEEAVRAADDEIAALADRLLAAVDSKVD